MNSIDHSESGERQKYGALVKRSLDVSVCLLSLPFFIILVVLVSVAIYVESPGSVFYIQERIGKDGRQFRLLKFRSMYPNTATEAHKDFMKRFVKGEAMMKEDRQVFKPFERTDVTKVGYILRKTSLDEYPQIINVLVGEMSLVGPRPNVPWEVEAYKDWHFRRLEVKPGITGLAQIRGRSGIPFDEIVRSDIDYIENQTLGLDLKILFYTVASVIFRRGAL